MQGRLSSPFKNNIQHFPVNHWKEEFQSLVDIGLGCIEWVYEYPTVNQNPLHYSNSLEEIKSIVSQSGIRINTVVADYFMVKHILVPDPIKQKANITVLKRLIDHSTEVGIPIIELPFVDSSSLEVNQFTDLFNVLEPVCNYAYDKGIKISFETDLSPKDFSNLIGIFSSVPVYINYDMGNSASLGFDPVEEIETLGERIINVHIKDRLLGGTTVPLGEGSVNFYKVFTALKKINYSHDFILQAARQDLSDYDILKIPNETIKEYIDFLNPWISKS